LVSGHHKSFANRSASSNDSHLALFSGSLLTFILNEIFMFWGYAGQQLQYNNDGKR